MAILEEKSSRIAMCNRETSVNYGGSLVKTGPGLSEGKPREARLSIAR